MPALLSFLPDLVTVRIPTGASLAYSVSPTLSDGTAYDLTGYDVETSIFGRYGAEPAVDEFAADVDDNTIELTLTPGEVSSLYTVAGGAMWGFAVWITRTEGETTERILVSHGDLEVVPV